jgi:hypothetical protein
MGRDFRTFYYGLEEGRRTLIKDPFAVFSTAWFARKLNFKVVIAVRHPLAFVSSLKRLNWPFDFQDLLDQPLLMRDHLEPFRSQMELPIGGCDRAIRFVMDADLSRRPRGP